MVSDALLLYYNRRSSASSSSSSSSSSVRLRKNIPERIRMFASLVVLMFPLGKRRLTSIGERPNEPSLGRGRFRVSFAAGTERKSRANRFLMLRGLMPGYRLAVGLSPGDRVRYEVR